MQRRSEQQKATKVKDTLDRYKSAYEQKCHEVAFAQERLNQREAELAEKEVAV